MPNRVKRFYYCWIVLFYVSVAYQDIGHILIIKRIFSWNCKFENLLISWIGKLQGKKYGAPFMDHKCPGVFLSCLQSKIASRDNFSLLIVTLNNTYRFCYHFQRNNPHGAKFLLRGIHFSIKEKVKQWMQSQNNLCLHTSKIAYFHTSTL